MLVDIVDMYSIDEIWCPRGPGPFTLMRVVTLSINALRYTKNLTTKSCHFFDLIDTEHMPIIEANAKECLIIEDGIIHIKAKELLTK